jgi:hypothetical protein
MLSYTPEPQGKSDVTLIDTDSQRHLVHTIFLEHRSSFFRDLIWDSEIEVPFDNETTIAFLHYVYQNYLPPEHILNSKKFITMWNYYHLDTSRLVGSLRLLQWVSYSELVDILHLRIPEIIRYIDEMTSASAVKWFREPIKSCFQVCELFDKAIWYLGFIYKVEDQKCKVHYFGWDVDRWDEWIEQDSPRIVKTFNKHWVKGGRGIRLELEDLPTKKQKC